MKQSPKINLGELGCIPAYRHAASSCRAEADSTVLGCAGKVRRGDEGDSFGMKFEFPWLKKLADKVTGKRM